MEHVRFVLRVSPVQPARCKSLYGLVDFVVADSGLMVERQLYDTTTSEASVYLCGNKTDMMKVCFFVQRDYPDLGVHLEPATDALLVIG